MTFVWSAFCPSKWSPMARPDPSAARTGGFTLVEVVVAVALVSVVLLGMVSAMRTLGQSASRLDDRIAANEELRAMSSLLRASLGVMEAPIKGAGASEAQRPKLIGSAGAIEWVGLFPARFGVGGMHRFRLYMDSGATVPALVLGFAPLSRADQEPGWDSLAPAVRIDAVRGLIIRYQDQEGHWLDRWEIADQLPQRLSVRILTAAGAWPDVVVAPNTSAGDEGVRIVNGPVS